MNESALGNRHRELGTIENPIVDSQLTVEQALRPNPKFLLPQEVFERQILLPVIYMSFDGKYLAKFLKTRGWMWGGDYNDLKDYQHFDKPLKKMNRNVYLLGCFVRCWN